MSNAAAVRQPETAPDSGSPFPRTERVRYEVNTLLQVICELRYPPILEIGATDPAQFQTLIRQRYPLYTKQAPKIEPAAVGELFAKLKISPPVPPIHNFQMLDEKYTVTLT